MLGGLFKFETRSKISEYAVGIIRCQKTEKVCTANTDVSIAKKGKGGFSKVGPAQFVEIVSCGGCPGDLMLNKIDTLVENGAQAIAFASCISRGNRVGRVCPNYKMIKNAVAEKYGNFIEIIEYTH